MMDIDTKTAILASAQRIITVANESGNKAQRHDLVVEAAAIIRLIEVATLPPMSTREKNAVLRNIMQ